MVLPTSRQRAGKALAKKFEDIRPLMDRYWEIREKAVGENQAALGLLADHLSAWRVVDGRIVTSDLILLAKVDERINHLRILRREAGEVSCMLVNVRSGGCYSTSGEMIAR